MQNDIVVKKPPVPATPAGIKNENQPVTATGADNSVHVQENTAAPIKADAPAQPSPTKAEPKPQTLETPKVKNSSPIGVIVMAVIICSCLVAAVIYAEMYS